MGPKSGIFTLIWARRFRLCFQNLFSNFSANMYGDGTLSKQKGKYLIL